MTEYFVRKDGNDGNTGLSYDAAGALLTIDHGISHLSSGDTLTIGPGTYDETICSYVRLPPSGSSWSSPTTIRCYPGATVWLKPSTSPQPYVIAISSRNQQYIVFDGLNLDHVDYTGDNAEGAILIQPDATTTDHIRFQNMEIKNSHWNGVLFQEAGDGTAGYCEFIDVTVHDCGTTETANGAYGFYITSDNNTLNGCTLYNISGYGIHCYNSVSPYPSHNTIRNLTAYNCSTRHNYRSAVILSGGDNNYLLNSVIYDNPAHGIIVDYGADASKIINCTIYNNTETGIIVGNNALVTNTVVKNTILYGNGTNTITNANGSTHTATTNLVGTDPLFADASGHDFRLTSDSPAKDAGTTDSDVTDDFIGTARPQGSAYDIGAYEYSSANASLRLGYRVL